MESTRVRSLERERQLLLLERQKINERLVQAERLIALSKSHLQPNDVAYDPSAGWVYVYDVLYRQRGFQLDLRQIRADGSPGKNQVKRNYQAIKALKKMGHLHQGQVQLDDPQAMELAPTFPAMTKWYDNPKRCR